MDPLDKQIGTLIEMAAEVRQQAHCKYSGFAVGAALLTESGRVYSGCNVENASFGLTICAERAAACSAVAAGERSWKRMVLVTKGAAAPCGACRQFLCEFSPQLQIDLVEAETCELVASHLLSTLLPSMFNRF